MNLFKPMESRAVPNKKGQVRSAHFGVIEIVVPPNVGVVLVIFGEGLVMEMLNDVPLCRDVKDEQTVRFQMF